MQKFSKFNIVVLSVALIAVYVAAILSIKQAMQKIDMIEADVTYVAETFSVDETVPKEEVQQLSNYVEYIAEEPQKEFFSENITFRLNFVYSTDVMPYALISPMENGELIADDDMPLIVWLHGLYESGVDADTFMNRGLLSVFSNWNLEGFRGYVICPQLAGTYNPGSWNQQKSAENLCDLLTRFIDDYKIDKTRIVIMGHSLGGQGSLYMAHHFNGDTYPGYFSKCVAFSGYEPTRDLSDPVDLYNMTMPVRGYVGSVDCGESEDSYQYMTGRFVNILGEENLVVLPSDHGNLPSIALNLDEDGNGRSDIIEWFFDADKDDLLD